MLKQEPEEIERLEGGLRVLLAQNHNNPLQYEVQGRQNLVHLTRRRLCEGIKGVHMVLEIRTKHLGAQGSRCHRGQ